MTEMTTLPPPPDGFQRVSQNFTEGMPELVFYHQVNSILGGICTVLAAVNLFIFISSAKLRKVYKILISLALADLINTIAMMTMGFNRQELYSRVMKTLLIPVRNSLDCAIEPWIWLKIIGDLWPPIIQFFMGFERACSLVYPLFFREKVEKNSKNIIFATILFVVISLATGFALAYGERLKPQMYYCGRKAAFSKSYGSFIYGTNVICYVFGFLFNLVAYCKALKLKKSTNRSTHLKKIRYYLFIAFFSTILVSVPNSISLCSSWIKEVDDAISKPAVWMACINSGLLLFVYIAFNKDYRQRLLSLVEVGREAQLVATQTTSTRKVNGPALVQTIQTRGTRF